MAYKNGGFIFFSFPLDRKNNAPIYIYWFDPYFPLTISISFWYISQVLIIRIGNNNNKKNNWIYEEKRILAKRNFFSVFNCNFFETKNIFEDDLYFLALVLAKILGQTSAVIKVIVRPNSRLRHVWFNEP